MSTDYDLLVIGGGAGGLTAAGIAANLGARVLLVERDRLGGDCTWTGCVPSKTLLSAARAAHAARHAQAFGVHIREMKVDFGEVMRGVRALRQRVYEDADAPDVLQKLGVQVRAGTASFEDARTVDIDGDLVRARAYVIATGASPAAPDIDGLKDVPYLTNETLFDLERCPDRLLVLGAGPVGIEMAQAFRRLGAQVTVIDAAPRILKKDDAELAALLRTHLEDEGILFELASSVARVRRDRGTIRIERTDAAPLTGDTLLVATGRRPNVSGLGLARAGVDADADGIQVNRRCRTSQSKIYAVGDVAGRFAFTHAAENMARTAVMNGILHIPSTFERDAMPWVTFTDPELAQVGATAADLLARGTKFETFRFPYSRLDRALTDRTEAGVIKVHATRWSGRILGASILGARAGELISEYALAMHCGIRLRHISDTVHPYPSYGLGVRRAADQWVLRRRSTGLVRLLQRLLGLRGPVLEYGPDDVL